MTPTLGFALPQLLTAALVVVGLLALAAMAAPAAYALRDASLKLTLALPNGAATTTSTAIDTGKSTAAGVQPGNVEYLLTAPALAVGELANAATMKYDVIHSANADLSAPTTYIAAAITQTGAGGAGAAAAEFRFRLPSTAGRYVGLKATNSGVGDASDKSATLEALF